MINDIRYAIRILQRNPGFTAVVLLSLALGIGANTAIFSVVDAVLVQKLPFPNPDQLVMVWEEASFAGFPRNTPAPANYADWKAQQSVFQEMAATSSRSFNLIGDGEPETVAARSVTANFFSVLGVEPALGRSFLADDDQPGTNRVVIISHALWQRRFGGDPSLLSNDILLNGEKYKVVGIMPRNFQFLEGYIGLWVPIAFTQQELASRGSHYLNVVARMKDDVDLEQAETEIQTITQRIAQDHPNEAGRIGANVIPLREQVAGEVKLPLLVLLLAVGFVLLIACANIASLLLARAATRSREIGVRLALGAGRGQIVRQLLTESLVLALAGGALGLLVASWSFSVLRQLIPPSLLLSTSLELNLGALVYTLAISLCAGLLFGLAPAIQISRTDLNEVLKQGGGRTVRGGSTRLRNVMVVAEVALALTLLVGAGLMIQTIYRLRYHDIGLNPSNVLTARTILPRQKYDSFPKRRAFYDQVLERLESLPGVISAGYSTTVPLEWKGGTSGFYIQGRQPEPGLSYDANHRQISPDYFKTVGIPLLEGRYFDSTDQLGAEIVAIVNETMASQYWPGENVIDKQFKLGDPDSEMPWVKVVGVVGDVRQMGLELPVKAEMYFPYRQANHSPWFAPRDLVVRTAGDPMNLVGAVKSVIHQVDPDQPVSVIRTLDQILDEDVSQRRMGTTLLSVFALIALMLASLGIYGVLSYMVVQERAEIGVRLALGARTTDILGLVLRKGMVLALSGIAIGLVASVALTRLMSTLLYGVDASDPATFGAFVMLLILIAFVACYIPARRATRVDPLIALRYE